MECIKVWTKSKSATRPNEINHFGRWRQDLSHWGGLNFARTISLVNGSSGQRLIRWSLLMLIGVPVGIVLIAVWSTIVKTSPTVADDERIRGWGTVIRDLPATAFVLAVIAIGFVLAVRAGRAGSDVEARRAILWHGAALFFVLLVVINGATENIMTTRPANVKWLLFPAQVAITLGVVIFCRRRARPARRTQFG